jgi:hypothetical protein
MNGFLASIDRKKLAINLVGYLVVFLLYAVGPPMQGFMGSAIRAYLVIFPAYYLGFLFFKYRFGKGGDQ